MSGPDVRVGNPLEMSRVQEALRVELARRGRPADFDGLIVRLGVSGARLETVTGPRHGLAFWLRIDTADGQTWAPLAAGLDLDEGKPAAWVQK